jgi:transposase
MDSAIRYGPQDIVLAVDYHDQNCRVRELDLATGEERVFSIPTGREGIVEGVQAAVTRAASRGGRVWWISESTTGWARVSELLADRCGFVLANVLQMPLPPKAHRRKTDTIDTGRLMREFLNGTLPEAATPGLAWRSLRRLAGLRENLVSRRTSLCNWINRYLAHEHWVSREGLWTVAGMRGLHAMPLPVHDRFVVDCKLEEIQQVQARLERVEKALLQAYAASPDAQRVDAIRGIGPIGAISIVARIGPIQRFSSPEALVSYAGLAPAVRQSDGPVRNGRIRHPGTDKHLRHYLIEASIWAREIPRYRRRYEQVTRRRGKKVGRLVVARLLLRSIYRMLHDGCRFNQAPAA